MKQEISFQLLEELGFRPKNIVMGAERGWFRSDLPTICISEKTFHNAPSDYAVASSGGELLFEIKTEQELNHVISLATKYK